MIKINLLPQNARKSLRGASGETSASRGTLIVLATAVLALVLNLAAGWATFRSVWAAKDEMNQVQTKHADVDAQIKKRMGEAEQVRMFREVVTNQMDVLRSLDPPERILWCEKLNMLANLIPADVFLSEVAITEQVQMVETEASKAAHLKWERAEKSKQGPEPQPVKRPLISYKMKVTGLALGQDNVEQFNNVMKFHQAMTTHAIKNGAGKERRFMEGFNSNVDLGSIEATIYEGAPVNKFIFTLTTKTMGVEELKAPKAPEVRQVAANSDRTGGAATGRRDAGNLDR